MTNFEFILTKMNDKNLTDFFFENWLCSSKNSYFINKVYNAFLKWRNSISPIQGNMYYIDRNNNPSVFHTPFLHFYNKNEHIGNSRNCNIALARTNKLSFQVWLSKQYNSTEWED